MKTCRVCDENKPLVDFNKKSDSKDGYKTICIECSRIYARQRADKNKTNNCETCKIKINPRSKHCRSCSRSKKAAETNFLGYKTCSSCQVSKETKDFPKNSGSADGLKNTCKKCYNLYMKNYYANNANAYENHKALVTLNDKRYKENKVRWRYNISEEIYSYLFSKYQGLCWSCLEEEAIAVDHDHNCCPGVRSCGNCIRGVLCTGCNTAAGLLKDSIARVEKLGLYLRNERVDNPDARL